MGSKTYSCINSIHNRACRFFFSEYENMHQMLQLLETGITPIFDKQWKSIIRLWCRLNNMSSNRLSAKVHKWADSVSIKHKCVKNWIFLEKI